MLEQHVPTLNATNQGKSQTLKFTGFALPTQIQKSARGGHHFNGIQSALADSSLRPRIRCLPLHEPHFGETIFVTAELEAMSGIIGVNKRGLFVLMLWLHPQRSQQRRADRHASRANLPGADDLSVQQYNQLFATRQYSEAVKIRRQFSEGAYNLAQHDTSSRYLIFHTRVSCARHKPSNNSNRFLVPYRRSCNTSVWHPREGRAQQTLVLPACGPVLAQGRKQLLEKCLKENKVFSIRFDIVRRVFT